MVTDVKSEKTGQPRDVSTQRNNLTSAGVSTQNFQGVKNRCKYIRAHIMELKLLT